MQVDFSSTPGARLAIVVPIYNEISGAEACVRRILAVLPSLPIPTTLITVDDGSTDGTGPLLDELQRSRGGFTVVHKENGGYGSALVAGANTALDRGYDYVLFMDSDLTNPPEHVIRFIPAIRSGYDLIKGSRFSDGGDMNSVPWPRRVYSVLGNIIARGLFRIGITDCTNGFRAIRTDLFLRMPLKESGFTVILEELYWVKRWGAIVTSVATSLTARTDEQRPSAFGYRPAVLWAYLVHGLRAAMIRYHPCRSSVVSVEFAEPRKHGGD